MARFDFIKRKSIIDKRAAAAATVVAPVATANASDLATAQALANSTKTQLNALIAALKAGGYIS